MLLKVMSPLKELCSSTIPSVELESIGGTFGGTETKQNILFGNVLVSLRRLQLEIQCAHKIAHFQSNQSSMACNKFKGCVTLGNILCNLSRNFVVTQVARKIA